ncbi:MAG: DUF2334 domain-containing protein [Pseudomonadota bacterium]
MTAPLRGKHYLPEIHDLYPGMAGKLDALIAAFPPAARPHIAYSVVPNWMGADPLDGAPDFVARLQALPGYLVLHGLTHTKGPDLWNWLAYGHENRSEFAGLTDVETAEKLDRGLGVFAAAGLARPTWFCAPRWTPSRGLNAALFERGFKGVLARAGLDLPDQHIAMPPLNFDEGARAWKIAPGRVLRKAQIARLCAQKDPFRLVLHPDDLDHPKTFAQFRRAAAQLERTGWTPMPLDAFVP